MRSATMRWPLALAGLWAVALAARVALLDGPLYGDEAAHYAAARHWGQDPGNVVPEYHLNTALWWQRPLFSLLLAPGAMLGLEAYRVEHTMLAALLPVLVAEVARRAGVRPALAAGAGLAVAVHPFFVLWGARVFPDSLMAVLVLGGLRAQQAHRPLATAVLLLAAAWVKETAAVLLLAAFAWSVAAGRRRGEVDLWPLRLDRPASALAFACALAPLPLAYAVLHLGGRVPGWSSTPMTLATGTGLFLTAWLIVPVAAGLAWRRSRPFSLLALVMPAFYSGYAALGSGVEAWYLVLPATLSMLAATVTLDEASRHALPALRASGQAATAVLAVVLLVLAVVPDTAHAKALASPGARPPASLAQLDQQLAGDDLAAVVEAIRADQWAGVFLVDVPWFHLHHPFAERADLVGWSITTGMVPVGEWAAAVDYSNATVIAKQDTPVNLALRDVYADCTQYEDPTYILLDSNLCPDGAAALRAALDRHDAP